MFGLLSDNISDHEIPMGAWSLPAAAQTKRLSPKSILARGTDRYRGVGPSRCQSLCAAVHSVKNDGNSAEKDCATLPGEKGLELLVQSFYLGLISSTECWTDSETAITSAKDLG